MHQSEPNTFSYAITYDDPFLPLPGISWQEECIGSLGKKSKLLKNIVSLLFRQRNPFFISDTIRRKTDKGQSRNATLKIRCLVLYLFLHSSEDLSRERRVNGIEMNHERSRSCHQAPPHPGAKKNKNKNKKIK
jgi:hypothetical protein